MPSRRDAIRMNDEEIEAFLQQGKSLQLATINKDGTPHLVAVEHRAAKQTLDDIFFFVGPWVNILMHTQSTSSNMIGNSSQPAAVF